MMKGMLFTYMVVSGKLARELGFWLRDTRLVKIKYDF
jgi:hypothetical protein